MIHKYFYSRSLVRLAALLLLTTTLEIHASFADTIVPRLADYTANRGTSALGMCSPRFGCKEFLKTFDSSWFIITGYLDNTFADNCKCLKKILKSPKPKKVRAHILNSTCFPERGRKCMPYECFGGMTQRQADEKIRRGDKKVLNCYRIRLAKTVARFRKNSGGPLESYVSPLLEGSVSREARKVLLNIAQEYFPKESLVDNPLNDSCLPGYICEKHGTKVAPIVDNDGADALMVDMYDWGKKNLGSKMVQAWTFCINGVDPKAGGFIDPRKRTNFCTQREWKFFDYWNRPNSVTVNSPLDEADFTGCSQKKSPTDGDKKGFLLKLGDGKKYAIALLPRPSPRYQKVWLSKNGQAVDTGSFRGNYTHDSSRRQIWDFKKHPAELPDNLVLHADNECWGPIVKPQYRVD